MSSAYIVGRYWKSQDQLVFTSGTFPTLDAALDEVKDQLDLLTLTTQKGQLPDAIHLFALQASYPVQSSK